jgi:DNA mismatch repair ATPase MutS
MDWTTVACETVFCLSVFWVNGSEVQARVDAVEEIKESTNYKLDDLSSLLTRLPDLEKGLVRIHYGRVSSPLPSSRGSI